jgi:1-acyl-sn-glycerol-3-phosphate acyltransferase
MEEEQDNKIDPRYHERDPKYVRQMNRMYKFLSNYHNHSIVGEEHIPMHGPCLFALNHSLATYDIGIFQYKVYKKTDVFPRGFADNAFFKVPIIGIVAGKTGAIPGRHHVGEYLLKEKKDLIIVAPGGMREALRPKEEKYQIKWDSRKGFVKLAIKTNCPIILAACPAADDLYQVYDNKLTKLVYNKLRLPLPFMKSAGKGILPLKIDLIHYVSPPFYPPQVNVENETELNQAIDQWHSELVIQMNLLMKSGIEQ